MRRNMGRRNNNSGGGGGGPLLTGHLQVTPRKPQDIDMELELLQRKREMIEQQQQLLAMEQQFKNTSRHSYDQMRYGEPGGQHGSNRDFTHMYETGPTHRNQFGRKRQAGNQWQYDSAPKRTPPKKKNPPQFNQHGSGNFRNQKPTQGSKFFSPKPLMDVRVPKQSIGQKIANQKAPPKTQNKDFKPSKVSKQKAPAPPNKLASHSVTERKKLVAAATEPSSESTVSRMLLPDRVPSQQVSGRLELALGAIMKNVRALIGSQPNHSSVLRSIQLQRVMKQAVRERIRTVMLGKVVGSLVEILAMYREEFPEETDADILNIALEAGGVSSSGKTLKTKFIESGGPSDFFRANMTSLIERQLKEMFSKLEEIYANARADVAVVEKPASDDDDVVVVENPTCNDDVVVVEKPTSDGDVVVVEEPTSDDNVVVEKPTSDDNVVIETPAGDVNVVVEKSASDDNDDVEKSATDDNVDVVEKSTTDDNIVIDEKPANDDNIVVDEKPEEYIIDLQKNADNKDKDKVDQEYIDFLNSTIKVYDVKRIIPRILKKYLPHVVKLLNVDAMYLSTKAAIITKTNEKATRSVGIKGKNFKEGQGASKTTAPAAQSPADSRPTYNLPYYVKIMGRPTLPKRKVMQEFLSQFNMKSIKKHRNIHNLLFVGFTEKTDYDAMVAADGTVIGRSTLSIRVCKKDGPQEPNGENGEDKTTPNGVSQEEIKKEENNKDSNIIPSELDGQITDLLSSIRKSEEEETDKGDEEHENEDGEANAEAKNGEAEPEAEDAKMDEEGDIQNDEELTENAANEKNKNGIDENITEENLDDDGNTETSEVNKIEEQNTAVSETSGDLLKGNITGRSTPARMSARLANVTPSTIRTRRASRLTPQN